MADVNLTLDLRTEVQELTTHRVRKYGFGDGYETIAADGINTRQTEYSITTAPITGLATQVNFQIALDNVAKGDYFKTILTPYSTSTRRYRLKDNRYERKILPISGAIEYRFTLIEAFSNV